MTQTNRKESIWNSTFIALLIMSLLWNLGHSMSTNIIPLYVRDLGATASLIGFMAGCFAITALAIRPFAGPAFDSFSKRRLLLASVAAITIASLFYGIARSFPVLIVLRFIHGIGVGCAAPLGMALASDNLPATRISSGISIYSIAQAVAQAIGPALGISLSQRIGYLPTFLVGTVLLVGACLVIAFGVKEVPDPHRPPYRLTPGRSFSKAALIPTIIVFLLTLAFACTMSFMAIYGGLRGVEDIGLYFTVYAGGLVITRPLLGSLSDRIGAPKVIVPTICCFGLSFFLISQAASLPMFLLAAAVAAFGFGACTPLIQADVLAHVPRESRGSASNTVFMGIDAANLIGPLVAGMVIEHLTAIGLPEVAAYSQAWLVMVIPIAAGLVVYLLTCKRVAR